MSENMGFYSKAALLDNILSSEPQSPGIISKIATILQEPAAAAYAFESMNDKLHRSWLGALSEAGYFRKAFSSEHVNLGRITVSYFLRHVDDHPDINPRGQQRDYQRPMDSCPHVGAG